MRDRKAGCVSRQPDVLQPETQAHAQRPAVGRWLRKQTTETEYGRCLGHQWHISTTVAPPKARKPRKSVTC